MFSTVVLRLTLTLFAFGGLSLVSALPGSPDVIEPTSFVDPPYHGNVKSWDGTTGNATQGQTACGQAWNSTDYLALVSPQLFDFPHDFVEPNAPPFICDSVLTVDNKVRVKVVGKSDTITGNSTLLLSPTAYAALGGSVTNIEWRYDDRSLMLGPTMHTKRSYNGDSGSSLSRREVEPPVPEGEGAPWNKGTATSYDGTIGNGQQDCQERWSNNDYLALVSPDIYEITSTLGQDHVTTSNVCGKEIEVTNAGNRTATIRIKVVGKNTSNTNNPTLYLSPAAYAVIGGSQAKPSTDVEWIYGLGTAPLGPERRSVVPEIEPRNAPTHRMQRRTARAPIVVRGSSGASDIANRVVT